MFSRRTLFRWAAALCALRLVPAKADMPKPRLCVWAGDRHKGNHVRPQRGDVVEVLDTMRHPGREVWGHREWRIVDVDLQVDDPVRAMGWLTANDDALEGYLRWFRRHTIDLDYLERIEARRLGRPLAADDILFVSPDALRALAKVKLSLPDPRIIRA
jgi:hypothetical protein